jgi:hypothetical protein
MVWGTVQKGYYTLNNLNINLREEEFRNISETTRRRCGRPKTDNYDGNLWTELFAKTASRLDAK